MKDGFHGLKLTENDVVYFINNFCYNSRNKETN